MTLFMFFYLIAFSPRNNLTQRFFKFIPKNGNIWVDLHEDMWIEDICVKIFLGLRAILSFF